MGIGILLYIQDCLKPDPTVKTAARVASHASHLINRTGSLMNMGYGTPSMFHNGEDLDQELDQEHKYGEVYTKSHEQKYHESSSVLGGIREEYIDQGSPFVDEETKSLNRRGIAVLSDLYKNIQTFKDEIIDFIRDKTELGVDLILDKRFKYNTLNNLGRENIKECVQSKDYTRNLIKIIAS